MLREDKRRKNRNRNRRGRQRGNGTKRKEKSNKKQERVGDVEGGVGVTKENFFFVIVGDFSLSFLKAIQVLILMLVNKMVVLVNKMVDLVHLLADLVIAGRFRHAIAVIVVTAKGMMVLFALFARIMNQKVLPPVWSFGSTVMTVEAGYTMCVPLE